MLNNEEFLRLQNLSALSLDQNQTIKLGKQLGNIVDFLAQLQNIPTDGGESISVDHTLSLQSGISSYLDVKDLFVNVKHDIIGNSIVITSVVDN